MSDRFSRQSFLGDRSEQTFQSIRAGIAGLGGGGSHIAQQLAHVGIGHFALFDPDVTDFPNLNRTVGVTFADAVSKTPKVVVAERLIRGINPYVEVWPIQCHWQKELESLRTCDVVFGCLDGFSNRAQLEETCRRAMIPLIDIGMDIHKGNPFSISGQVVVSMPGHACFRCMNFIRQDALDEEGRNYGEAGGKPQVVWSNGALASTAVGMFVQMFTPWCEISRNSAFMGYDGDKFTIEQDSRQVIARTLECSHFGQIADLGDPLYS